MSADFCPSCGEAWEGERPRDPWYTAWYCQNCGRCEDEIQGRDIRHSVVREGKELSRVQWEEVAKLKAEWAQQEEEEGDGHEL